MREPFTCEDLGTSPSWVKSENELDSLILISVDIVVITELSYYLAQPPGSVKTAYSPVLQGTTADAGHTGAGRRASKKQSLHYINATSQWL